MRPGPFIAALLLLSPGLVLADQSVSLLPNTPAARSLATWLDAFNSGERERIGTFDQDHVPWWTLDRAMTLRADTGGYQLLGVEKSDRLWIIFRAKEKANSREVIGRMVVTADNPWLAVHSDYPSVISWLSFSDLPANTKAQIFTLNAAELDSVIAGAAKLLDELYVFPDVGRKISNALAENHRRGLYRPITDGQIFAWRLSDDLWAIAHDGHLGVRFSPEVLPPEQPDGSSPADPTARHQLLADNCGFEKAEHLAPNIGYLKINRFADPDICAPTAIAGLNFLAGSDALIIDLRDNHGGQSGMVTLIASYLFAAPTHLSDAYDRGENRTIQFWTSDSVSGKRFIDKPVFVLTSRHTFSAAEDLSYALKNLKRATLIGETTGGGSHPISPRRIDEHFTVVVPVARSISPITKTDWEGTGVEPDVKVPAADAVEEALRRAR